MLTSLIPNSLPPLLTHLLHCVFMALITHVKGMRQTQRFTTLPVNELGVDGWMDAWREREKKKEGKQEGLNGEAAIFQDCFYSPDKAFTWMHSE